MKVNVVGNGLQPQSRIRADALGISDDRARALQRQAEDAWELFKPYADAAEILDFDEIQFLAMARVVEDGEAWVIPTWAEAAWRPYGRCLQIIESDRVTSPLVNSGQPEGSVKPDIQDGIEYGTRGQPLAYYVRKSINKARTSVSDHLRIPARDAAGRPKILHVFPSRRAGQARGVPLFAPALTYFKDLADYLEAEVVGARVAACLAVFITKQDAMFSAQNMGTSTETGTNARIQGIEPGMVSYLSPGEAINTVDPRRPGDSFGMFLENVIRIIGNSLGLPYELIAKDFSKTNYSSARASLLEGRRHFMNWRKWLARKVCQPVWELVLEEAYLRGRFDAKDFYRHRHEYCRAMWIGGGWGWVDPVKEVDASRKAVDYGLSNLAEECAAQGRDWEENLVQLAREQAAAKELGVEITGSGSKPGPAPTKDDEGKDDAETK